MSAHRGLAVLSASVLVSACSTPAKLAPEQLVRLGITEGAIYWQAEQKLAQEGYRLYVSGAKRENFDFTKQTGAFPTCLLRIQFTVDDDNKVRDLRVKDPVCIGTP